MLTAERLEAYLGISIPEEGEAFVSDDGTVALPDGTVRKLTPRQRRRLRHKAYTASGHTHERVQRCPECRPVPRHRTGTWRESDQPLLDQL